MDQTEFWSVCGTLTHAAVACWKRVASVALRLSCLWPTRTTHAYMLHCQMLFTSFFFLLSHYYQMLFFTICFSSDSFWSILKLLTCESDDTRGHLNGACWSDGNRWLQKPNVQRTLPLFTHICFLPL